MNLNSSLVSIRFNTLTEKIMGLETLLAIQQTAAELNATQCGTPEVLEVPITEARIAARFEEIVQGLEMAGDEEVPDEDDAEGLAKVPGIVMVKTSQLGDYVKMHHPPSPPR